jgi:hypothetical protein
VGAAYVMLEVVKENTAATGCSENINKNRIDYRLTYVPSSSHSQVINGTCQKMALNGRKMKGKLEDVPLHIALMKRYLSIANDEVTIHTGLTPKVTRV